MPTVDEEIGLGRDDDLSPLERIASPARRDVQIDGLTASDTEDDEEALILHARRRNIRRQAEYQEALGREQERLRRVQLGREAVIGVDPVTSTQIPPNILPPPPVTMTPPPSHLGHPNGHSSHVSTDPTLTAILESQRRQEAALRDLRQRNLALEFENYQLRNLRPMSRGSSSRGTSGHQGRIRQAPPAVGPKNSGRSGPPLTPPVKGYGPPDDSSTNDERREMNNQQRNTRSDNATEAKLRELEEKIKKMSGTGEEDKLSEVISEAERTPFTQELELRAFPPKCTLPNFPSRRGKEWFYNLAPGTVNSYENLVEAFLDTYMHNNRPRPKVNRLFTLAPRFREPLRSLTDRWRNLCTEIGKVPVDQQIFGFENTLGRSDPIWVAMFTEKPQTLKEMRKMKEHFISLEEIHEESRDRGVQEASAAPESTSDDTQRRPEKIPSPPVRGNGKKGWITKGKRPRHEARTYTPLNAPLEEIFKEVEKMSDIIYPASRGIQFEETKDHPEYCHYHQYRGHSTKNCREVKYIVKHLIRDGYLRQFVRHPAQTTAAPNAPVHQVRIDRSTQFVNTISHSATQAYNLNPGIVSRIHKRNHSGKEIFSVAKSFPMEPWMVRTIFFSAQDVPMNDQAHSDPLVITLLIEEWGVRRILVDSGSSVEVLFYDTFKRMELSDDILIPSTYRIYGFNGMVTIPKGEVTLRVSYGGGYLDTLNTFYVVDVASTYEYIIGRPWIAGIKGVASAYHQRLRFPTYKGIAEVVGDPQASRQCMQADTQINEERRARQRGEKKKAKEAKVAEELEKVISQAVMAYEAEGSEPS
ncbi:uncharacterized protein LOC113332473 [Papaver somniferum]|uniref:uncharacterized protein LOC113332473 n=1 Tax=Papaver somniferum TaxID=3469 RepID=UPI000E6F9758|nr:uncharacterized protein LOC113332473 [Papaver somniferum]